MVSKLASHFGASKHPAYEVNHVIRDATHQCPQSVLRIVKLQVQTHRSKFNRKPQTKEVNHGRYNNHRNFVYRLLIVRNVYRWRILQGSRSE